MVRTIQATWGLNLQVKSILSRKGTTSTRGGVGTNLMFRTLAEIKAASIFRVFISYNDATIALKFVFFGTGRRSLTSKIEYIVEEGIWSLADDFYPKFTDDCHEEDEQVQNLALKKIFEALSSMFISLRAEG